MIQRRANWVVGRFGRVSDVPLASHMELQTSPARAPLDDVEEKLRAG